jgi:hypothetical protein
LHTADAMGFAFRLASAAAAKSAPDKDADIFADIDRGAALFCVDVDAATLVFRIKRLFDSLQVLVFALRLRAYSPECCNAG